MVANVAATSSKGFCLISSSIAVGIWGQFSSDSQRNSGPFVQQLLWMIALADSPLRRRQRGSSLFQRNDIGLEWVGHGWQRLS